MKTVLSERLETVSRWSANVLNEYVNQLRCNVISELVLKMSS